MHFDISRTTLWRLAQLEGFPEPLKLGRAVRYRLDEVEAFLRDQEA
ncbi:AlpA family phage regulatory protein [Pseudomonas lactis]|jgi:Prophage CP4-57 regulatory protein (AlpA).|nr:AlpA family phage regulatory protein [Pseudomonas lactis]MCF5366036.1 AlpA family phage regulatory protein [Pseudomonas sp. PA-4-8C]MCF5000691.1 AlpA family phage regulatory protein [Pseudomonas lactis]MCF5006817.1 AlpA family phage regulatory protein [Pseudomonas lactis]MCF5011500.1 AlpA family phage regulatory protein [Pseudomonas lactis]